MSEKGTPKKRRQLARKQVKQACMNCKRAHTRCEEVRPCPRCEHAGIQCVDAPRKRKRKEDDDEDESDEKFETKNLKRSSKRSITTRAKNNSNKTPTVTATTSRLTKQPIKPVKPILSPPRTRASTRQPKRQKIELPLEDEEVESSPDVSSKPDEQQQREREYREREIKRELQRERERVERERQLREREQRERDREQQRELEERERAENEEEDTEDDDDETSTSEEMEIEPEETVYVQTINGKISLTPTKNTNNSTEYILADYSNYYNNNNLNQQFLEDRFTYHVNDALLRQLTEPLSISTLYFPDPSVHSMGVEYLWRDATLSSLFYEEADSHYRVPFPYRKNDEELQRERENYLRGWANTS